MNLDFLKDDTGSYFDLIPIPILILSMGIVMVIMWTLFNSFPVGFMAPRYIAKGKQIYVIFDAGLIFMVVSIIIGAAAMATQLRTHPVFAIGGIIFMILIVNVSAQLGNVAWSIFTAPQFITASAEFPRLIYITRNLPRIMLVGVIVIMIAMYAKPHVQQTTPM